MTQSAAGLDDYEIDDDGARIDLDTVCTFLSQDSYWAKGRPRDVIERSIAGSARVIGIYRGETQVGFARVISDGAVHAYLADVFVVEGHRGKGLGRELVAAAVTHGPHADLKWLLHTADAHELYKGFGFTAPSDRVLERRSTP